MKFIWNQPLKQNTKVFLNRLGYHESLDRRTQQASYIRRLGSDYYPRLHLYINLEESRVIFKLHLDEKKASYEGSNRHSGQYEGEILENEMHRIIKSLQI